MFAARCPSMTVAKRKELLMSSAVLMETILGRCACIFEPGAIVAALGFSVGRSGWQLVRGAAVQSGIRKVHGRFQGPLPLRRRAVVRDAAKSLPHVVRRLLQLLLHAKRHSVLQLHVCQLPLQVRIHRRRLLHYLHQRRQAMLQHAAMLLRLLLEVLRKRLLLLCGASTARRFAAAPAKQMIVKNNFGSF